MNRPRMVGMTVLSIIALLLIGWGSRAPYRASAGHDALLRLSWRMRPERNELCRERSAEELAALPVHMRAPRVCETHSVPYQLILQIGDGAPDTTVVLAAGARHDRPIYVLRDSLLAPGARRVRVTFERVDTSHPAPMILDDTIRFERGHIELITISSDGRTLEHRSAQ